MTSALISASVASSQPAQSHLQRIAALASDVNSSPKDWVSVLGCIPDLSGRILQIVNASYGGLHGRIATIHQAIVHLGFNTVKNLASRLVLGHPVSATAKVGTND